MRTLVTCILANIAADLSGWEWVYSLNRVTILCINIGKIDFLGKKYFSWGKFAEGKTPIFSVTFLVKKTPAYAEEVIKKTSISVWNSSILSRQFLRKLSIISVTWTSAIY